jgi:hypothetical protein
MWFYLFFTSRIKRKNISRGAERRTNILFDSPMRSRFSPVGRKNFKNEKN